MNDEEIMRPEIIFRMRDCAAAWDWVLIFDEESRRWRIVEIDRGVCWRPCRLAQLKSEKALSGGNFAIFDMRLRVRASPSPCLLCDILPVEC